MQQAVVDKRGLVADERSCNRAESVLEAVFSYDAVSFKLIRIEVDISPAEQEFNIL